MIRIENGNCLCCKFAIGCAIGYGAFEEIQPAYCIFPLFAAVYVRLEFPFTGLGVGELAEPMPGLTFVSSGPETSSRLGADGSLLPGSAYVIIFLRRDMGCLKVLPRIQQLWDACKHAKTSRAGLVAPRVSALLDAVTDHVAAGSPKPARVAAASLLLNLAQLLASPEHAVARGATSAAEHATQALAVALEVVNGGGGDVAEDDVLFRALCALGTLVEPGAACAAAARTAAVDLGLADALRAQRAAFAPPRKPELAECTDDLLKLLK